MLCGSSQFGAFLNLPAMVCLQLDLEVRWSIRAADRCYDGLPAEQLGPMNARRWELAFEPAVLSEMDCLMPLIIKGVVTRNGIPGLFSTCALPKSSVLPAFRSYACSKSLRIGSANNLRAYRVGLGRHGAPPAA